MITKNPPRPASRPSARRHAPAATPSQPPADPLLAAVGTRGYLGPATVVEVNDRERIVLVRWEQQGKTEVVWARLALVTPAPLRADDTGLVATQDGEHVFLIGLLASAAAAPAAVPPPAPVAAEVVQVCSPRGELVVEYHPASGKTVVNVEHGDLEFVTREGSIAFNSAKNISLVARRLETQAETVVSRAKNTYETVEELHQLQAGRTRTLVQGSCLLKARDAFLKAETDFKIDGEQIHLG